MTSTTSCFTVTPGANAERDTGDCKCRGVFYKAKQSYAVLTVLAATPGVPDTAEVSVETCAVIEATRVDRRGWPGVRAEVEAFVWDGAVSQGGSVAGGIDVTENAALPVLEEDRVLLGVCDSKRVLDWRAVTVRRVG